MLHYQDESSHFEPFVVQGRRSHFVPSEIPHFVLAEPPHLLVPSRLQLLRRLPVLVPLPLSGPPRLPACPLPQPSDPRLSSYVVALPTALPSVRSAPSELPSEFHLLLGLVGSQPTPLVVV